MKNNYHTHTTRCNHATGRDEEYVLAAIESGFNTLGFSDHTPYPFPDGYISGIRMGLNELDDYCSSISRLRDAYKDDIKILIGLEAEYFPLQFDQLLNHLRGYPIDYLILGQHFLDSEYLGKYAGSVTNSEADIAKYAEQVIAGLRTGKFIYLAHPDLINFVGEDAVYEKHMQRICEEALALDIPLEVNMQGMDKKKWYPCSRFFRIAQRVGNRLIFGYDAHSPHMLSDSDMVAKTLLATGVSADSLIDHIAIGAGAS